MPMPTETVTPTTDASQIPKVVAQLREAFEGGRSRPIDWRAASAREHVAFDGAQHLSRAREARKVSDWLLPSVARRYKQQIH